MQQALYIIDTLDKTCDTQGITIDSYSDPCSIKAELLYSLCFAVGSMYEKLVQQDLVQTGSAINKYTLH
jgi:hypothetical protein